ncbi:MAG TPA: hypothetical protein VF551_09350 [Chthoniobacterales bacterium]
MIEDLLRALRQPEYVHTLLNPLPIYGLILATVGLVVALLMRSRPAQITALLLVLISALAAWPAIYFGERAYDHVLTLADPDGRAWLEAHADRAERLAYLFYALAATAALALLLPRKWPALAMPLAIATLLLALVSLGAGASIAYAGGKIRHREFRTVPPPERDADRGERRVPGDRG